MGRSPRGRYRALLLSLFLLLVAFPLSRDSAVARVVFDLPLIFVVLGAILPVFPTTRLRLLALTVGGSMLVVNWTGYVFPDVSVALGFHALAALFLGFTAAMIIRAVSRDRHVTADSINGALCGYLLAGIAFGHLYCLIESVTPGSFAGKRVLVDELQNEDRRRFLLTYFSFTTLTTLGYGDITPATDVARGVSAVEAVFGQFYVAVLIAEFVGKRIAQATAPAGDTDASDTGG